MHRSNTSRLGLLAAVVLSFPTLAQAAGPDLAPAAPLRWVEATAAAGRCPALLEAAARARGAPGATSAARVIPSSPGFGPSAGEPQPDQFRPLLMTALTSHLPTLYAQGSGAGIQKPLVVVVMGGLDTFTALTLLVPPAIYQALANRYGRNGAAATAPGKAEAP